MSTTVKAKVGNKDPNAPKYEIDMDIPADLAEATEAWGEQAVYDLAIRQAIVGKQAAGRVAAQADGATQDSVANACNSWTPGVRRTGAPRAKKVSLDDLSIEQLQELLQKAKQKAKQAA